MNDIAMSEILNSFTILPTNLSTHIWLSKQSCIKNHATDIKGKSALFQNVEFVAEFFWNKKIWF